MTAADPAKYDWLNEDLAWFGVGACVTVSTTAARDQLAAAFGADLSATPVAGDTAALDDGDRAPVGFLSSSGCEVAIEVNGFRGSETDVLEEVSTGGRAASAFWNVEDEVRFACAEDGELLYDEEFTYDGTEGLPDELVALVGLVAVDLDAVDLDNDDAPEDGPAANAVALVMLETYTGVELTPGDVTEAVAVSYPVR
jgi:hypothetical protein